MSTSFRSGYAVLLICAALAAAAVAPAHSTGDGGQDFTGTWITWAEGSGGERPVCRRLHVSAGGPAYRHGGWDAPGWNGLVSGTLGTGADGSAVWHGEWRDGQIAGTFALTLRAADAFEGVFAGAGVSPEQRWRGRRDTGDRSADVPCRSPR